MCEWSHVTHMNAVVAHMNAGVHRAPCVTWLVCHSTEVCDMTRVSQYRGVSHYSCVTVLRCVTLLVCHITRVHITLLVCTSHYSCAHHITRVHITLLVCTSHYSCVNYSCFTWGLHVAPCTHESCHRYQYTWVMSHVSVHMSHVTRISTHESCHMYHYTCQRGAASTAKPTSAYCRVLCLLTFTCQVTRAWMMRAGHLIDTTRAIIPRSSQYRRLQIGWHRISSLFLKPFQRTRILPHGIYD